ncbi:MAG: glycosyltransferase family 87 protein [Nitrospirota bacterium]
MPLSENNAGRSAWTGWIVLFLVTAAIIASGSGRTVVPAYHDGAVDWIAGKTLFANTGVGGFIYLPQAAILFIPLALLPVVAGEVVWRFVNIGVFAFGIFHFAGLVRGNLGKGLFPLMTLVTLPLAWDCARNGQATLIITGLMLLAVVDIVRTRWWRVVLWLCLGVAVKPLVIVLALLVMVIDRPLSWRLLVGMLMTALFPFLTQHPGYVLEQYAAFWNSLTMAVHVGSVDKGWTTPFNALQLAGVTVPERAQTLLRLAAALGTLVLCRLSRLRHDAVRSAVFVFSLSVVYLMLFSPRTENNTYAMLGPAIAVFLAGVYLVEQRRGEGLLLSCMAGAILGGRVIERLLTPHAGTSWVSPLVAVCFTAYLMVRFVREMQGARQQEQGL